MVFVVLSHLFVIHYLLVSAVANNDCIYAVAGLCCLVISLLIMLCVFVHWHCVISVIFVWLDWSCANMYRTYVLPTGSNALVVCILLVKMFN